MNAPTLTHDTLTIERTINASSQQVFNAWADPAARSIWGPTSDDDEFLYAANCYCLGCRRATGAALNPFTGR